MKNKYNDMFIKIKEILMFYMNRINGAQYVKNSVEMRTYFSTKYGFVTKHNFKLLNKFIHPDFYDIGLLEECLGISNQFAKELHQYIVSI